MKFLSASLLFVVFSFYLFAGEPCIKTTNLPYGKNMFTLTVYPNCGDSSVFFVRTYEDNKLKSEEWFKDNLPHGICKYFQFSEGKSVKTSEALWNHGDIVQSISYFQTSMTVSHECTKVTDSSYFDISYYANGLTKEWGNVKGYTNCRFGQWSEFDSSGAYKWIGQYKIVNREERDSSIERDTGLEFVTVFFTCSEKDGLWKKIDDVDYVLEEIIYENGKPKK